MNKDQASAGWLKMSLSAVFCVGKEKPAGDGEV